MYNNSGGNSFGGGYSASSWERGFSSGGSYSLGGNSFGDIGGGVALALD